MAKPYTITITNGVGSGTIATDTYNVTASVNGYDNVSIDPSQLTINTTTGEYELTIAATGTLTLHVTEEGMSEGTPVVGAKFVRCDDLGNTYGAEIETNEDGDAVFNYVPYAEENAPTVFYKQIASDGEHDFETEVQEINLTTETSTEEIFNYPSTSKTLKLTDTNYANLPIANGSIILS